MSTLDLRIENTFNKIAKLEQKLERITLALNGGNNPYFYDEGCLRQTKRELDAANQKLLEFKNKKVAEEKLVAIPVIEEFLEQWKQKTIEWYKRDYYKLLEFHKEYNEKKLQFDKWKIDNYGYQYINNNEVKVKEKEMGVDYSTFLKQSKNKFNSLTRDLYYYNNEWESRLENVIEQDKNAKRRTLLKRVNEVVGDIKDAQGLYIAKNCEINGYITGDKGKARVETISAGGWNIQCFHYRVLVKLVK